MIIFKFKKVNTMISNFSYITRSAKYTMGAAILTAGLGSAAFGLQTDNNGYYQIITKEDLKEFAQRVNSGVETNAKGMLMKDIVFNGGSVIENGEWNGGTIEGFCYNSGEVNGNQFVGGNIGANKKEGTINKENFQNTGTVNKAESTEENKIGIETE